jgi:Trp operon repressor
MNCMRKKLERMKPAEKVATEAALAATLKRLDNRADYFINNLMTERERFMIGRRVLISNLILSGYTQMEINQRLSVSPNTFTKIKR